MVKPSQEWDEDDWCDEYRKRGEHVALVDLSASKIEGTRWLGAQKFVVAENNRRHMEPIKAASKSRRISWIAVFISAVALVKTILAPTSTGTPAQATPTPPTSQVLPVPTTTLDIHTPPSRSNLSE